MTATEVRSHGASTSRRNPSRPSTGGRITGSGQGGRAGSTTCTYSPAASSTSRTPAVRAAVTEPAVDNQRKQPAAYPQ
jgi:hypothetical protein